MSNIVLEIETKFLSERLVFIFVVKEHITILAKSFNSQLQSWLSLYDGRIFQVITSNNFNKMNFIWLHITWNIHFMIDKFRPYVCNMLLLKYVWYYINKSFTFFVPYLSFILICWKSNSYELSVSLSRLVMSNYNHFCSICFVENWALNYCVIWWTYAS